MLGLRVVIFQTQAEYNSVSSLTVLFRSLDSLLRKKEDIWHYIMPSFYYLAKIAKCCCWQNSHHSRLLVINLLA
jgi:hypothetical protein